MEHPNYYAIIPANVRYDKKLKDKAKLLYGEITALSNKEKQCWASNRYFADLFGVSIATISRLISNLIKEGYIDIFFNYEEGTKLIKNRILIPIDKNVKGYYQNRQGGIDENVKDNNTSINNKKEYINNIVEQVINYMNELANTSFKTTTQKTRSLIKARLDDGFTVEDLKDVVFYTYKEWVENKTQWHDGVYSDKYFRPSTIFAGSKIEGYLQDYKRNYD